MPSASRRWCTDPAPSVSHDRPLGYRGDSRRLISTRSRACTRSTRQNTTSGTGRQTTERWSSEGDITVWVAPAAIATWEAVGGGTRGGQRPSSDLAIETALTLRLIVPLPLRQTEGFLTSRAPYMCTRPPLVAPHTSPSLRLRTFPFPVAPTRANVDERRLPPRGGPESMTPHETVLTITPGDRPGRRKLDSYRVGTRETGDRDSRWSASGCMLSASPASFDPARPQHRPDERASTTRPRAPQTDRPRT